MHLEFDDSNDKSCHLLLTSGDSGCSKIDKMHIYSSNVSNSLIIIIITGMVGKTDGTVESRIKMSSLEVQLEVGLSLVSFETIMPGVAAMFHTVDRFDDSVVKPDKLSVGV